MMGTEALAAQHCPDCGTPAVSYTLLTENGQPWALRFVCSSNQPHHQATHQWRVPLGEAKGKGHA